MFGSRAETRDELLDRLRGADAFINVRAYTRVDGALLDDLPGSDILILGPGTDNIDLEAASARGVTVTNTPERPRSPSPNAASR